MSLRAFVECGDSRSVGAALAQRKWTRDQIGEIMLFYARNTHNDESRGVLFQLLRKKPVLHKIDVNGKSLFILLMLSKSPDAYLHLRTRVNKQELKRALLFQEKNGFSALTHAIMQKVRVDILRAILDDCPSLLTFRDKGGRTLLHYAAMYREAEVAQLFLEKGANANAMSNTMVRPIHCAAARGKSEMLQCVVEGGGKINVADKTRWSPLHYICRNYNDGATKEEREQALRFILERSNETTINLKNADGFTPLHLAAQNSKGSIRHMELLLGACANLSFRDNDGNTPLHTAVFAAANSGGNPEAIRLLSLAGASWTARNKPSTRFPKGRSALLMAEDHPALLKYFVPEIESVSE